MMVIPFCSMSPGLFPELWGEVHGGVRDIKGRLVMIEVAPGKSRTVIYSTTNED
jgi:hypothetical protein